MSFKVNWPKFTNDFIDQAKTQLTIALNKGNSKPPNIVGDIIVHDLYMGSKPPELEMLEIGDLSEDRFKGVFKLTYVGDAHIILNTKVQANPLNASKFSYELPNVHSVLAANQPLVVPMRLRISNLKLRGIVVLVVDKAKGTTLVFKNDPLEHVHVSSSFDGVPTIRRFLQEQIEGQFRLLFQEDLPQLIHSLSLVLIAEEGRLESPVSSIASGSGDSIFTNEYEELEPEPNLVDDTDNMINKPHHLKWKFNDPPLRLDSEESDIDPTGIVLLKSLVPSDLKIGLESLLEDKLPVSLVESANAIVPNLTRRTFAAGIVSKGNTFVPIINTTTSTTSLGIRIPLPSKAAPVIPKAPESVFSCSSRASSHVKESVISSPSIMHRGSINLKERYNFLNDSKPRAQSTNGEMRKPSHCRQSSVNLISESSGNRSRFGSVNVKSTASVVAPEPGFLGLFRRDSKGISVEKTSSNPVGMRLATLMQANHTISPIITHPFEHSTLRTRSNTSPRSLSNESLHSPKSPPATPKKSRMIRKYTLPIGTVPLGRAKSASDIARSNGQRNRFMSLEVENFGSGVNESHLQMGSSVSTGAGEDTIRTVCEEFIYVTSEKSSRISRGEPSM